MVKANPNCQIKRGTKRKIDIEKITDKACAAVAYSKRTGGIHSKASQLCLLDGSQIAVLAAPPSSDSHVSFYSFGFPSVDAIVSSFLSGQPLGPVPPETENTMREDVAICMARRDLGLGFWWEDKSLVASMTRDDFLHSMSKVMMGIEGLEKLLPNQTRHKEPPQPQHHNFSKSFEQEFTSSFLMDSHFTDHHHHHEASTSSATCHTHNEDQDMALPQHLNFHSVDHLIGLEYLLSDQNHASTSAISDTLPNEDHQEIDISLENLVSDGFFDSFDEMHHFSSTFLMESDPYFFYDSQLIQIL